MSFREKAGYTATALFVFLVCSQLPLYGIKTNSGSDPFYWARVIMASNRRVLLLSVVSCVDCKCISILPWHRNKLTCW